MSRLLLLNTDQQAVAEVKGSLVPLLDEVSVIRWRDQCYIHDNRLTNYEYEFYVQAGGWADLTDKGLEIRGEMEHLR